MLRPSDAPLVISKAIEYVKLKLRVIASAHWRIAARFFDRSNATKVFKRGMDAYNSPGFYRQLGKDPDQIVTDALVTLRNKFDL